ncbi:MAG TPA: EamA family transporter [Polyangiaceae bacterium]
MSGAAPTPPKPGVVFGLMALLCAVWGSTWLVIAKGLHDLPPLTGAAARFVLASLVMVAIAPALARREGGHKPPFRVVLVQGVFQFTLNFALVYLVETVLPSGLVSVLWATFPLMMALTGHFITKSEPLVGRQWLGLMVAFLGVVALFWTDVASIGPKGVGMGLVLLLGPASVTYATTLIKRHASGASSALLNRDSMLLGALLLSLLALVFERSSPMRWTPAAAASIVYLALFGSVLTFGAYVWLLRSIPAYRLSLVSYVTPVVALALGASLGGEPLRSSTLAGTALVLAGVALTLRSRAASAARPEVSSGAGLDS